MNKSRLVWGIICLALAILLAVLNGVLPEDQLMFQIGDWNEPLVPVFILAVLGVVLLGTAGFGQPAAAEAEPVVPDESSEPDEKAVLNSRLETIGWGLFLIMIGGITFVPTTVTPEGIWNIGVGVIMLGLNAARFFFGIRMSAFTLILGTLALLAGIGDLVGFDLPTGPILLILVGANLILKPLFDQRTEARQSGL